MTPAAKPLLALPEGYVGWLARFKGHIRRARQRTALAVNAELVQLYGRLMHGQFSCPNSTS